MRKQIYFQFHRSTASGRSLHFFIIKPVYYGIKLLGRTSKRGLHIELTFICIDLVFNLYWDNLWSAVDNYKCKSQLP